jgi:hypothetical protein
MAEGRATASRTFGQGTRCHGCHRVVGSKATRSVIGDPLCPGCSSHLDTATSAQLAMGGLTNACATAAWLQRPMHAFLTHWQHSPKNR